jgi:hypothetical protein
VHHRIFGVQRFQRKLTGTCFRQRLPRLPDKIDPGPSRGRGLLFAKECIMDTRLEKIVRAGGCHGARDDLLCRLGGNLCSAGVKPL